MVNLWMNTSSLSELKDVLSAAKTFLQGFEVMIPGIWSIPLRVGPQK